MGWMRRSREVRSSCCLLQMRYAKAVEIAEDDIRSNQSKST